MINLLLSIFDVGKQSAEISRKLVGRGSNKKAPKGAILLFQHKKLPGGTCSTGGTSCIVVVI
jgi:hypothetical protein